MPGQRVFEDQCSDCHSIEPAKNKRGPTLAGVVGRAAASVPTYHYSDAMLGSHIVWSPQRLAQYLASPKTDVPGTKMRLLDRPTPAEIQAVITYLQTMR